MFYIIKLYTVFLLIGLHNCIPELIQEAGSETADVGLAVWGQAACFFVIICPC
jgi:hypothetical protein